jgi:sugar phosphate isomerase/epimerase
LKYFLILLDKKNIGAVFDTGNRVLESDNLYDEIKALGDLISHVHIKDKDRKGNNVILGTGLVNFQKVFDALEEIDYKGKLNFETTRGADPLNTATYHLALCKFFINEAAAQ